MPGFERLKKGFLNKDVAEKYGVPRNTISTWVKNKSKCFAAPEQSLQTDYKRVDRVCWSFCKDSNNCMCTTQLENNSNLTYFNRKYLLL